MKVIDLFNMISRGEDVPEKFKFAGQIFEKQGSYIEDEDGDSIFKSMFTDFSNINDEVEIIEEDKKIEHYHFSVFQDERLGGRQVVESLESKINEIIDKINKINKMEDK